MRVRAERSHKAYPDEGKRSLFTFTRPPPLSNNNNRLDSPLSWGLRVTRRLDCDDEEAKGWG